MSRVAGARFEPHYGWVMVAAGALISCVAFGAMFALPVYLAPIAAETGWSRAGISAAMTLGFVTLGVGGFFWGTLSDRIGPKPVVLIAALMLGAGLALASQARDLLLFQLAYGGLMGAATGAFMAPIIAATLNWFETHKALAISLVSLGAGVAPMVMTPLTTVLIEAIGWRMAMLSVALAALVLVFPAGLLIRRHPGASAAPAPQPAGKPAEAATSRPSLLPPVARRALASPKFLVLAAVFFLCCGAHSGPIFHTVSYAMICGATPLAAAGIYSLEGLAGLFGRVGFGVLADRIGVKSVIVGGLALQAAGIFAYIYVSEVGHFYLLALVLGLVYGGVMPLYSVLAKDYFAPEVMGTVLGAMTMTSSIGMAFGPVGGGWLYDTFGTYHWLYIASAAVGLGATALAMAFPRSDGAQGGATPLPQAA